MQLLKHGLRVLSLLNIVNLDDFHFNIFVHDIEHMNEYDELYLKLRNQIPQSFNFFLNLLYYFFVLYLFPISNFL